MMASMSLPVGESSACSVMETTRTALLRSGPACVVPFNAWVLGSATINQLLQSAMAHHLILNGNLVEGKALQALV